MLNRANRACPLREGTCITVEYGYGEPGKGEALDKGKVEEYNSGYLPPYAADS